MARLIAYDITEAMLRYGGSFVRTLAALIRAADEENERRLLAAFPEYIEEYRAVAALHATRAAEEK